MDDPTQSQTKYGDWLRYSSEGYDCRMRTETFEGHVRLRTELRTDSGRWVRFETHTFTLEEARVIATLLAPRPNQHAVDITITPKPGGVIEVHAESPGGMITFRNGMLEDGEPYAASPESLKLIYPYPPKVEVSS